MGTEAVWVPLVMSAVAAGATAYNTNKTAKRQDSELARGIMEKGKFQREADGKVSKLIQDQQASTPDDERRDMMSQFSRQLAASDGQATNALNPVAGTSTAYQRDAAAASLGVTNYGQEYADLISRVDAPTAQRRSEAKVTDEYKQDLGEIERRSRGQDFLSQMRLQGIKRNPWIDAGASALSGYAGSMGGGGGAGWGAGAQTGTAASGMVYTAPTASNGASWLNAYRGR
ncbi:MAG: hypothetical protein M3Q96_03285 [Pseudomonadota bacterium]|nr:hypothetical protein [Pseudomonadota bacterium]